MRERLKLAALLLFVFLLSPLNASAGNVGISSVSEPATLMLMGVGLFGLAFLGRNRFKK